MARFGAVDGIAQCRRADDFVGAEPVSLCGVVFVGLVDNLDGMRVVSDPLGYRVFGPLVVPLICLIKVPDPPLDSA